ncbi:M43 family zinc metalloprotease [Flavobacterium myungsuense]|uniref:M43 family zinc metalloprotease n=1 Tax=Flavobacterium myungsuense TaxID=651823 RepID=A0ABW3J1R4_9FLAO
MNKIITILVLFFSVSIFAQRTCGTDAKLQELIKNKPGFAAKYKEMMNYIYNPNTSKNLFSKQSSTANTVVTIPIVFHVLYKNANQNISDAQIQSQIDVLNKDFRKLNTDFNTVVPNAFKPLAADVEILFCKATKKPDGTATTGITRKSVPNTFDFFNEYFTASGQLSWDNTKYLNIWIGDAGGTNLLGLHSPADDADGVAISHQAFGTSGTALSPFRKGRTTTHEIGHYFGLNHPFGDGNCKLSGEGDRVADTPATKQPYYGCPTFPNNDINYVCEVSTNGAMFMNYMEYVNDACMAFFTLGQKEIMRNSLAGPRLSLLSSNGCGTLGLNEFEAVNAIAVYPNPVSQYFMITSPQIQIDEVELYNVLGQLVKTQKLIQTNNTIHIEELPYGTYYLRIYNQGKFLKTDKIIKK